MAVHNPAHGKPAFLVQPGSFRYTEHYYPKVLNAQIHSMVAFFLSMTTEQIVSRYCHLHPQTPKHQLSQWLDYSPKFFAWSGSDLFNVTTSQGVRRMVLLETNSSPSGQKSLPLLDERAEQGGYRLLLEKTFKPMVEARRLPTGGLAVLYDKNPMETTGYTKVMADVFGEPVFGVEYYEDDPDPSARFDDGVLHVRDADGVWHPIRAAFRYVTQRPWTRIPILTKTFIFNPVLACLSGGRNKLVAAKAYDIFNAELVGSGLAIQLPHTIRDVQKEEIPMWLQSMGGFGVVKIPYSNAGQGVFTITSQAELEKFMERDYPYDQFIVQSLIGNYKWSSRVADRQFFHVGTVPNQQQDIYVADIRMMIHATDEGFRPLATYARRARMPLMDELRPEVASWDMLGTNLSVKTSGGGWDAETERLMIMDRRDFNRLGVGLDDLIEGFVQAVLATIAIDKMAAMLLTQKGRFRYKLYRSLNNDDALFREIEMASPQKGESSGLSTE